MNASEAQQAADAIKSLGIKFQNFLEAASFLEKLGSLAQAEQEYIARVLKAEQSAKEAEKHLGDMQIAAGLAEGEAGNAKKSAQATLGDAQKKHTEIIEAAKKSADEHLKKHEALLKDVESDIATARNQLSEVNAQLKARHAEHESILKQISETKAKVAHL